MASSKLGTSGPRNPPSDLSPRGADDDAPLDMVDRLHGATRFTVRFGLLMTGLMWFLSGAQISLSLFVALEPPRFIDCSAPIYSASLAAVSPSVAGRVQTSRQLQQACNPDTVLDPTDCTSPHRYLRPGISIVSTYDLPTTICEPRPWKTASWVHSALFAGILVGAVTLGPVSDSVGRRPTITLSTLCLTIASIYSVFSPTILIYGFTRFLVGIFITGAALPSLVLLSEVAPNDKRQWIMAVQAFSFCVAAVYVAVLACFVPSWRVLTLLVTLPAFFFLFGCVCCGGVYIESPRWLAARGRMEEAFGVWLRIAKICRIELPEDFNLDVYIRNELQAAHDIKLRSAQEVEEELSYMSLKQIVTPDSLRMVMRTFPTSVWMWVCMWLWVTSAFVYYGVLFDLKDIISEFHLAGVIQPPMDHNIPLVPTVVPSNVSTPGRSHVKKRLLHQLPLITSQFIFEIPPHDNPNVETMADNVPSNAEALPRYLQAARNEPYNIARNPHAGEIPVADLVNSASSNSDLKAQQIPSDTNGIRHANQGASHDQAAINLETNTSKSQMGGSMPLDANHIGVDSQGLNAVKSIFGTMFDANHTNQYREVMKNVTQTLRNGTRFWLDSARNISDEAQRAVEEYEVVPKVNQFVQDIHSQFEPTDVMAPYWRSVRTEGILVVCSFLTEIPAYLLAMTLASSHSMGRRTTTFAFLMCGSILLLTSWGSQFGMGSGQHKGLAVVSLVLGRCCVAAVFMLLYLYCAEIFPTSIRASTLGLLSASARIGCILAAPLAQYLDTLTPQGAVLCFAISALIASMTVLSTLPETLGKPLYDTMDTLEEAYQNSGYIDHFFDSPTIKFCGFIGRCTCCLGRLTRHCLAIPGDSHPTSFEAKGQQWLKEQWKKTGRTRTRWNKYKDQAQRAASKAKRAVDSASGRDRANFMPLHDMMDNDSPPGIQHATALELGEESDGEMKENVFRA